MLCDYLVLIRGVLNILGKASTQMQRWLRIEGRIVRGAYTFGHFVLIFEVDPYTVRCAFSTTFSLPIFPLFLAQEKILRYSL